MKEVNLAFTHDTEVALASVADLVNSLGDGSDHLADLASLDAFVARWGWTGARRRDQVELAEVRALRQRLRPLWELDEDGAAAVVNELLQEGRALPQLVTHDGWGWHLHATAEDAPLAHRMAVEAAMAVIDVIRAGELDRLHVCAADDCADVLVDLSRNRSRRYCGSTCSNRVNVAAFRARRAAGR